MLTQKRLKELVDYDHDTGEFTCLIPNRKRKVGQVVGSYDSYGYKTLWLDGKCYKLHRLVFLYMEGSIPHDQVDHINRIKDDNRWSNLRHADNSLNQMNCGLYKNNASGKSGVKYHKTKKKWEANYYINKVETYLGSGTKEHCIKLRQEAELKYGYTT